MSFEKNHYLCLVMKKILYIPTFGEEVANSVSHGVMAILMLLALPFATLWSYTHAVGNNIESAVGVSVCFYLL